MPTSMSDVLCIGQAVVDCITYGLDEDSLQGKAGRAESITLSTGGDALNESIILSRLGYDVMIMAFLGEDPAGRLILDTLLKEGVDTSLCDVKRGRDSVVADILVKKDGSRKSVSSRAAMLEGAVLDLSLVKGAKILSLASLFRAPLDDPETVLSLVKKAKDEGMRISADTKVPVHKKIGMREFKEVFPYLDILFPNETEASYLAGFDVTEDPEKAADFFLNAGVRRIVLKLGAKGSLYKDKERCILLPPSSGEVIDTTGAGDNYVAGFLSGILDGEPVEECLNRAFLASSIAIRSLGAHSGIREKSQILKTV